MKKGLELIKEFVIDELSDYGYFDYKDIKHEDSEGVEHYYTVEIKTIDKKTKTLYFKYDSEDDKIFIAPSEDNYEEVVSYNSSIKFFWMSLLEWEV